MRIHFFFLKNAARRETVDGRTRERLCALHTFFTVNSLTSQRLLEEIMRGLLCLCCLVSSSAFTTPLVSLLSSCSSSILFSTPPRQPRRNLKKRRKRRDKQPAISEEQEFPWETAESRSLVSSRSKEAGEDYWIDEDDLLKSIQRTQAIKNRKVRVTLYCYSIYFVALSFSPHVPIYRQWKEKFQRKNCGPKCLHPINKTGLEYFPCL